METAERYRTLKTQCGFTYTFEYLRQYTEGRRVLDLGCGTGEYLGAFSRESVGVDISEPNIEECRNKGLQVVRADLNRRLPFDDNEFEVVFSSHTIEHVDSPLAFLREIARVLMPRGVAIIGVPIEKTLVRLVKDPYFEGHRGHIYGLSLANMRRLFAFAEIEHIEFYLNLPLIRRSPSLDRWMQRRQLRPLEYIATMYWAVGRARQDPG